MCAASDDATLVVIPVLYYVAYGKRFDPTPRLVTGIFILLSLALGIPGSPIFVSQWWLVFTAFVSANLLQSALTGWCLMETIVATARHSTS